MLSISFLNRVQLSILYRFPCFFSDAFYLKRLFRIIMGRKLNLQYPVTYNEKLQWLKLYDHNPLYVKMVDKYEAKRIVKELLGDEEHIIPTIAIYDSVEEIDYDLLPQQFVIKCTHDSGSAVVCKDKATLDIPLVNKKIKKGLRHNFFWRFREWPYKEVPHKIIVEQYIGSEESCGVGLDDYKFFCFDGRVDCILLCKNRDRNVEYYYFTRDWDFLRWDVKTQSKPKGFTLPKPDNLEDMIFLAEKLASIVRTVRVDLYSVSGRIYFGEYTFFTNSGFDRTINSFCDRYLGEKLQIPLS